MGMPIMDSPAVCSAYGCKTFQCRITFAASTASTWRSRDVVVTRPTATTLVFTFPQPYTEIVDFSPGRKAATGTAITEWIITTDNLAVDGTVTCTSVNNAGTATAPQVAEVLYANFTVSQDAQNDKYTGTTA